MTTIDIVDDKVKNKENIVNIENKKKKKKNKKKNRCSFEGCNKKLSITCMPCSCNKKFCPIHRIKVKHNCEINICEKDMIKNNGLGGSEYKK